MTSHAACGHRFFKTAGASALIAAGLFVMRASPLQATSGTWLGTQDNVWVNSANWSASPYAGTLTGETATFDNAGNNNTNLNIAGLYSIGTFIFKGASVAAYTIGTGAPNSQTLVMGSYDSTYRLDSTCANSQIFNCQIQLGGGDYNSSGIFQNDTASQLLTLNKLFAPNSSPNTKRTVTIKGTGPVSILGNLVPAGCTLDLVDEATGDLTLSGNADLRTFSLKGGACALTGANGAVAAATCTVSSGSSLLLNNTAAANHTDRLGNATRILLSGGTLRLGNDAGDADFSETVGDITLVSGNSTIAVDQAADTHTAILHIASLSRNSGATVNFTGNGLGESDRCRIFIAGQDEGLIGSWVIVNGTHPAYYLAGVGVCTNAPAQGWAVTNIAARGNVPNAVVPDDESADVRITEEGDVGAVTLAGDPVNSVGILRQYADVSSVIATADKTLRAYTVGIAAGAAPLMIGESAGDGTLTPLTAGGILTLDNASGSALTVNAALADNGSTSGLQKSGDGSLVIAGPTLYTGPTLINGGSLTFDGAAVPQSISGIMAMNGHSVTKTGSSSLTLSAAVTAGGDAASIDVQEGILRLESGAQLNGSAANTNQLHSGTTLDLSTLVSRPVWSLVCEDNTRYNVSAGASDIQNNWAGPVTLNGTLYLTGSNNIRGGFSGEISGSGSLFLTNASGVNTYFLITGTNNTYAGPTRAIGGFLYVNSIRNVGEPSSLGRPMTVEDGTIRLGDTNTPGRLVYRGTGDVSDRIIDMAGSGANGWTTLGMEGTGPLVYSNLTVSVGASKILYLIGNSASTAELVAPVVNGSSGNVSVDKQNSSTWILSGDCTYGGATLVEDGTLVFKGNNTLPANVTVRKGLLSVEGTLSPNNNTASCYLEGASTYNALLRLPEGASMVNNNLLTVRTNGAVYIEGGTLTRASNINTGMGEYFAFGHANNGYGYLKMSGGTVTSPRIILASTATATPNGSIGIARLSGGTATFSSNPHIGAASNSIGVLTLDNGGSFLKTGSDVNTYLGYFGGRGELNLTGGYLNNNNQTLIIGQASYPTATGIVNLCAGSLANTILSRWSGKFLLNFCGGTLAAGASSPASMISGADSVYSFGPVGAFSGGACFDTAGRNDLYIGATMPILAPTGQGVQAIALSKAGAGYIGEPYVEIRGGGGNGATAVANMIDDGTGKGTFKVASVTITCPGVDYTSAPTVTFLKGGANAVAATGSATLAANMSGGLTKLGAGTLTLNAPNTYGGATTVASGTLKLGNATALPTGTPLVLAGGTLDLNGATVTNALSGSGTLTNGTVEALLSPAGAGTVGTNALTLSVATLRGTYQADVTAAGASDRVEVTGDINLSDFVLQLVDPQALDRLSVYTIMTCTGTASGSFAATNLPEGWHVSSSTASGIKLLFSRGTLMRVR